MGAARSIRGRVAVAGIGETTYYKHGQAPRSEFALNPRDVGLVALVGLGDVAANLSFGLASRRDDVSVVSVLGSLYPVVTVLLARGLHGERLGRLQSAGVAGALAGVVLIATG